MGAGEITHWLDIVVRAKELGAYQMCAGCHNCVAPSYPSFVAPNFALSVMTWVELLEHTDNLSEWGVERPRSGQRLQRTCLVVW